MAKKCALCKSNIKEDELGKLVGTIVKIIGKDKKNKLSYVCSGCQKKYQDAVKKKLIKEMGIKK